MLEDTKAGVQIAALKRFSNAALELSRALESAPEAVRDAICNDYPFDCDFQEKAHEILDWHKSVQIELSEKRIK